MLQKLSLIQVKTPVSKFQHQHGNKLYIYWVKEAFNYLTRNQAMVKHSFEVCGITVSDTEKVRNADFYKQCTKDVLESLGNEVEEDNDDLFTL